MAHAAMKCLYGRCSNAGFLEALGYRELLQKPQDSAKDRARFIIHVCRTVDVEPGVLVFSLGVMDILLLLPVDSPSEVRNLRSFLWAVLGVVSFALCNTTRSSRSNRRRSDSRRNCRSHTQSSLNICSCSLANGSYWRQCRLTVLG